MVSVVAVVVVVAVAVAVDALYVTWDAAAATADEDVAETDFCCMACKADWATAAAALTESDWVPAPAWFW